MSNLEQVITTGIGATIGFFVGGPAGALAGAQYGLLAGSVLFPGDLPGVEGPRLQDFERLNADPGAPIAQVYGIAAVPGFRLYLGPVTEISSTEEVGGKGAPSQDVTTFHYLQTLAIGLCEGPILGVSRIWENGELVYDVRGKQEGETDEAFAARLEMSAIYADTFTLYVGDEEQEPDPTLEDEQGVGNVPGFRGLAYIVYPNRELKDDQGRRHPVFKFEIREREATIEYQIVAFTETGPHSFVVPDGVTNVDVLVVGGGGASGATFGVLTTHGPGGGAGGEVRYAEGVSVSGTVAVTVGAGGTYQGTWDGEASAFGTIVAAGGSAGVRRGSGGIEHDGSGPYGGGGSASAVAVDPGGVGSLGRNGGNSAYSAVFGRAAGGGGGGAGQSGTDANVSVVVPQDIRGGAGGDGLYFGNIFGDEYGDNGWFGGGGGGSTGISSSLSTAPAPGGRGGGGHGSYASALGGDVPGGMPNTGGGAGGGGDNPGGHGVVLVRYRITSEEESEEGVALSSIVSSLCERSGLSASDIDVSTLQSVRCLGYVINRETTGRAALEQLRMFGRFDIVESDGVLKFPRRGAAPVATLSGDDLGVFEEGSEPPPAITCDKLQDVELPRQIRLRYPSYVRDYEFGEQLSPARIGTTGVNDISVECPVVMLDQTAAQLAEILFREAWASRWSHSFTLGPEYHALEPSDPVLIPMDGRWHRARIVSIDDTGLMVRRVAAVRDDDGAYVSVAIADAPRRPPAVIELIGDTEVVLLDIPALREDHDNAGFYLAAYRTGVGQSWPGARIYRSVDAGATYQQLAAIAAQAVVGVVESAPEQGDGYTWDDEGEIVVSLINGELESRTDSAVLAGANAAAIGSHGRWQIVQFSNAELIGTKRYRLSRLLLGRRGTEHLIGDNVQSGDLFVLISGPGIYRMPLQSSEIGAARIYRAVTTGAHFESAEGVAFTGQGRALECFSPVYVHGDRDSNGDVTISWLRRDRLNQPLRSGVPLGMSEASLAFEVDILSDDTSEDVLRTIQTSIEEAVYTAAQQIEDFGSPQEAIKVRVYQISATVGRGIPAEATV